MEIVEIKNSTYQEKIGVLNEVLNYLKEAAILIRNLTPTEEDQKNIPNYCSAYLDAEANCSAAICDLSHAVGELVSEDLINFYL